MNQITTLAVSAGDPDGIGYDLCALLYEKQLNCQIVIYGDQEILLSRAKLLGIKKLQNEKIAIHDVKKSKKIKNNDAMLHIQNICLPTPVPILHAIKMLTLTPIKFFWHFFLFWIFY